MGDTCAGGWDDRWHQETHEMVRDHDRKLRGNGEKGLIARTETIEEYIKGQIERDKEERQLKSAREEEERKERQHNQEVAKANRFQIRLATYAGLVTLFGLLLMSIFDHTIWKPTPPVEVQQTTTTDTLSTTKIQKR